MQRYLSMVTFFALGCTEVADGPDVDDVVEDSGPVGVDADGDGYFSDEDCNDDNPAVNPGAAEECNGLDDNCDGAVDEGLYVPWYQDQDQDGYGDPDSAAEACEAPSGFIAEGGDCDDTDPAINPDAEEQCDVSEVDEDCDGLINADDPDIADLTTFYTDADGDGFGDPKGVVSDCQQPAGTVVQGTDCDDTDPNVNPDADEVCDELSVDEDCDGWANEDDPEGPVDAEALYEDIDGDGYGTGKPTFYCDGGVGASMDGDCDDNEFDVNPGAIEVCSDSLDNDCDGTTDVCPPLGEVDIGTYAEVYTGETTDEAAGFGVSRAGDLDGDGNEDLVVGGPYKDGMYGSAYVLEGPLTAGADLGTATAELQGKEQYAMFGQTLGKGGDLNDDGFDDVLVGTYALFGSDGAFVYFGPVSGTISTPDVTMLEEVDGDGTGRAVEGGFDIDDDGYEDLIIGGRYMNGNSGGAYLLHGPLSGTIDLSKAGAIWDGVGSSEYAGVSVAGLGDVLGTGTDNVAVGAPYGTLLTFSGGSGSVYLMSKAASGDLDVAADAILEGVTTGDAAGFSISSAGDHNDDGYDDIIVGAPGVDISGGGSEAGAAYVVFGPVSGTVDLAAADVILSSTRPGEMAGWAVASEADFDKNGYPDLLVSALQREDPKKGAGVGATYVVLGPLSGGVSLDDSHATLLGEGASNYSGWDITGLSDQDGDGYDEMAIGAPAYLPSGMSGTGAAYVVYGADLF